MLKKKGCIERKRKWGGGGGNGKEGERWRLWLGATHKAMPKSTWCCEIGMNLESGGSTCWRLSRLASSCRQLLCCSWSQSPSISTVSCSRSRRDVKIDFDRHHFTPNPLNPNPLSSTSPYLHPSLRPQPFVHLCTSLYIILHNNTK